jgi:Uma2 family endonuclease
VQSAVTTLESEPEPDVVVVRGGARDFVKRHPGPEQIGLVVEVADTSLTHDRTVKGRIYARAGIANYWIVNLIDRRIEVYSDPAPRARKPVYRARRDFGPGEAIPLSLGGRVIARVDVDALLP